MKTFVSFPHIWLRKRLVLCASGAAAQQYIFYIIYTCVYMYVYIYMHIRICSLMSTKYNCNLAAPILLNLDTPPMTSLWSCKINKKENSHVVF